MMVGNALTWVAKAPNTDILPGQVFTPNQAGGPYYTRFADLMLADNEYWFFEGADIGNDGIAELWAGLEGKSVWFFNNIGTCPDAPDSNVPHTTLVSDTALPEWVGSITAPTTQPVQTDEFGWTSVTVRSTVKGYQYVYAVADYTDNTQVGDPLKPLAWGQLKWDCVEKLWEPEDVSDVIKIFAAGDPNVEGLQWANWVDDTFAGYGALLRRRPADDCANPNTERIAVQVFDQYGNALEGYKVTFEVMFQGSDDNDTYFPYAHFRDVETDDTGTGDFIEETPNHDNPFTPYQDADVGDRNPNAGCQPDLG